MLLEEVSDHNGFKDDKKKGDISFDSFSDKLVYKLLPSPGFTFGGETTFFLAGLHIFF